MNLCANATNPDSVREWWRNIFRTSDVISLAKHNGHPQLCQKIKIEVLDMLKDGKGDLRRRILNIDSKRHREDKPMLTGQETLR